MLSNNILGYLKKNYNIIKQMENGKLENRV